MQISGTDESYSSARETINIFQAPKPEQKVVQLRIDEEPIINVTGLRINRTLV